MLKIACFLTGDNYELVSKDTPYSKKKVITLALAMLVPILIWAFNGYKLARTVLESSLLSAIFCSIGCATLVFLLEKLIVMANGSKSLNNLRICIGILVAVIGSIALDEVIFKSDLDYRVARMRDTEMTSAGNDAAASFDNLNGMGLLKSQVDEAQVKYDQAEKDVINEANGTYGTGKRGVGKITALKQSKATQRKADLNILLNEKKKLDQAKATYVKEKVKKSGADFSSNGLLVRIKALYNFVFSDLLMGTTYLLLTMLLFLLEFLVVFVKKGLPPSNHERKLEMIEEIGRRRMAIFQQPHMPASDPGYFHPAYQQVRESIERRSSIFNK